MSEQEALQEFKPTWQVQAELILTLQLRHLEAMKHMGDLLGGTS